MKFLLDFFPIVLFFIVYKTSGLNLAIVAMTFATIIQILYTRWKSGKFERMQVITLGLLIVFGGLTIYINNPAFIMWKVSVLYVVFAVILLASLLTRTTILEKMLGKQMDLPEQVWRKLTWFWGVGFIGIATINAYFVDLALSARDKFLATSPDFVTQDLSTIDCTTTNGYDLCIRAQELELLWVDFKLFGTLGLTLVLLFITIFMVKNYIKDEKNTTL
jgi:intracellular septation protein